MSIRLEDVFELAYPCDPPHIGYWLFPYQSELTRAVTRGERRPRTPLRFKVVYGRKLTDFLGNSGSALVVSRRVVDLLKKNKFTGWRTFPATIVMKNYDALEDEYFVLVIKGRAGKHDTSRGVRRWFKHDDGSRSVQRMNGLYFKPRNWDGSDFFMLEDCDYKMVTKRVIESLQNEKITGYEATPIREVRF